VLTIVFSPLQALMKDQVDDWSAARALPSQPHFMVCSQLQNGVMFCAESDWAIALFFMYRRSSFETALFPKQSLGERLGAGCSMKRICLSKWGHDFRPDYMYAGRFIREFSERQGVEIPPIACFTATAKQDVSEEILAFFKGETGRELKLYAGGVEREKPVL
jgi:ATP-dependent DNA helicase RecQ